MLFDDEPSGAEGTGAAPGRARRVDPRPTLVLVDRRRLIREAVRVLVETRGAARVVGVAEDGSAGLELVVSRRARVVVADAETPGPTGLEIVSASRSRRVATGLVLMGPAESGWWAAVARDDRVAGYVTLADEPGAVVEAVRAAAEGRRYCSPRGRALRGERAQMDLFEGSGRASMGTLTAREVEVMVHLARGLSIKQVAGVLSLSVKTVDNHAQHLMAKLGVHSRAELVRVAIRERVLTA